MQDSRLQQAQVYTDFNGLSAIKTQAQGDRRGALSQVAKQFEGLFLAEMMKSMRSVNEVFSEGNYLNSSQGKMYQDMFDKQLTLSMTQNGSFGLAETLERQLSRQIPGMTDEGNKASDHKASIADYDRSLPALTAELPEKLDSVYQVLARSDSDNEQAVTDPVAPKELPRQFGSAEEFVNSLMPLARRAAENSNVDPRLMVAQAALETGWGKHMIEGDGQQPSYNLFGIKADQRWAGESVRITTTEYREGVPMKEQANFRAYSDYQGSFEDYLGFLERNPRYTDALAAADRPAEFARKLQEAGYATDPAYSDKIRRIMASDPFQAVTGDSLSMLGGGEE